MSSSSVTCLRLKSSWPPTSTATDNTPQRHWASSAKSTTRVTPAIEIPKIEQQLNVLERAGVAHVDCHDGVPNARLDDLVAAIERGYRAIPETLRRDVEYSIRREQRARDSMTIDR